MPADSTPAEQRQALIDRLNNTDLSRIQQRQGREDDEQDTTEPDPAETTDELPDEPEPEEDPAAEEEAPEDEPTQDEAEEQMETLRGEIEELKAKLEKATAPGGTGSPPSGGPAPSASKAFTKIREKLAKSRTEWGELVDATGLEELLNELEPMVEQLGELKKSAEQAKIAETRQKVAEAQQAAQNVHSILDGMARRSPELARLIGTAGTKATKSELAIRQAVLEEAQAEQARSNRLSGGRNIMSNEDALAKGAQIVFRAKAGKPLQLSSAEQKARDRARMITPSGRGGSTAVPANSAEAGRQRAEANVEAYLRNRGG